MQSYKNSIYQATNTVIIIKNLYMEITMSLLI